MAIDNRVMSAALFAEKVVEALGNCKPVNPDYGSPAEEAARVLREANIAYLSCGHYGVALLIPGTTNVLKVCTSETDGYPMYAQWAQQNPGPCIPEIFWTCRVSPTIFVCAMPAYKERHEAPDFYGQMADEFSQLHESMRRVRGSLKGLAREDTHSGNFMYCPVRKEIIITDPYANLFTEQDKAECTATGRSYVPQIKVQQELFGNTQDCAGQLKQRNADRWAAVFDPTGKGRGARFRFSAMERIFEEFRDAVRKPGPVPGKPMFANAWGVGFPEYAQCKPML